MKKINRITALILVLVMMLTLSGCGKMTTEKLALKMVDAAAGKTMTQATVAMEMEMDLSLGQDGITMDMGMDVDYLAQMKMQSDPYALYSDMTMDMSMEVLGQTMEQSADTRMYAELDGSKVKTYTYDVGTGTWQTAELDLAEVMKNVTEGMDYSFLKDMIQAITLDEETQTVNGAEVYVLRMTITGEQMQKAMGGMVDMESMLGQAGLEGELDISALSVPTVMYVNTKTYLPVKMEMEMTGMGEVMQSMMDSVMEQMVGIPGMSVSISIPVCRVVYDNIGYDPVEIPEVPAEAKN